MSLSYSGTGHHRISTVPRRSVDRKIREKRNDMKTYRGREIETEQLDDGKWIACAQNANGVMVVARPGWHYETEEDAIADVEALIDQQLLTTAQVWNLEKVVWCARLKRVPAGPGLWQSRRMGVVRFRQGAT